MLTSKLPSLKDKINQAPVVETPKKDETVDETTDETLGKAKKGRRLNK